MRNNTYKVCWGWYDGEENSEEFSEKDYTDSDDGTAEEWAWDTYHDTCSDCLSYGGPDWADIRKNGKIIEEWNKMDFYLSREC